MSLLLIIPFVVQTIVITFDEFYFHVRRGLPLWERIGHPLDTLSVVSCLAFVLIFPYTHALLVGYIVLAAASCLLVTKDEFVHKEHCEAKEQWLHSLLFINHPLVLISLAWMWSIGTFNPFLTVQLSFTALFCLYQIVYWNLVWKQK